MDITEEMIERLKNAIEGECDGLAIDDAQAKAILEYVATVPSASPAVVVKPLEWEASGSSWWESTTLAGKYRIEFFDGRYAWTCDDEDVWHHGDHVESIESAKAAAQADYSARIMSAIEPAGVGVETKTERVMSDPCVQKLEEGEPFFVLLGRDADASQALSTWITLRLRSEGRTDKVKAAEKTLDAFRDCQDRRATRAIRDKIGAKDCKEAADYLDAAVIRLAALSAAPDSGREDGASTSIERAKAEAFDKIVAARKKHVYAVATYNARRKLVNAERMRGNWAIKLDAEYRAMSDAQAEYHRTVQDLADAALTTKEASHD